MGCMYDLLTIHDLSFYAIFYNIEVTYVKLLRFMMILVGTLNTVQTSILYL